MSDSRMLFLSKGRFILSLSLSIDIDKGMNNSADKNNIAIAIPQIEIANTLPDSLNTYTDAPHNSAVDTDDINQQYELSSTFFFISVH